MAEPDAGARLAALSDEIRGMAAAGLHFTHDPYDRTRYERLIRIAAELLELADPREAGEIERAYRGALGMITPVVGVDAAIFDDDGRLLLTCRADTGTWCMPGGAVDLGESPSEAAEREAVEETGLRVRTHTLIGVYDNRRHPNHGAHQVYHLVFAATVTGGTLTTSHETTDFAWCTEAEATSRPLFRGHVAKVPLAFAWYRDRPPAAFD